MFKVITTCQGQPFEHECKTLIGALLKFAVEYIKKHKYGTMNFTLLAK